jgi:hypothetical protein
MKPDIAIDTVWLCEVFYSIGMYQTDRGSEQANIPKLSSPHACGSRNRQMRLRFCVAA